MSKPLIKPQTLRGFRDYLPTAMLARERLIDTARRVYRSYGFAPIDTPALEYTEVLLGKGGGETDKQMFRFEDQGGRDVAMRFDLTIPFARYAAQHINDLGTPFKRYHIGTVWRAERPQKGRYREFMQCDFDTIGTRSNAADVETLLVIHDLFEAIGREFAIPDFEFTIHVNNRMVLNGLLEAEGLQDRAAGLLRSLDKLPKIGGDAVVAEMVEQVGVNDEQARRVLALAETTGTADEILGALEKLVAGNESGAEGIARLRELFAVCASAGLPAERVRLDPSIARGLDYYTGTIFETFLGAMPSIGSVCSGGRYDNLAGLYTSQELPGVGASLGLDRLLAALEELDRVPNSSTPAQVLIAQFDAQFLPDYFRAARDLQALGIATEVYPEARPLKKQLRHAERKGFQIAVIGGEQEIGAGEWQIKDLSKRDQQTVANAEMPQAVAELLGNASG